MSASRLLGIELEFDATGGRLNLPSELPAGWVGKPDGSLGNGRELVMDPPKSYDQAVPVVQALNTALDALGTYASKRGGMHVHVQGHDLTPQGCARLANLYRHFQPAIDQLVGKSRVDNRFCPPYPVGDEITVSYLNLKFRLLTPASSRASARGSRSYSVVNFAMMRCSNREHRTVEFRQGSTSKRADCVLGWTALMLALVELSLDPLTELHSLAMGFHGDLPGLKQAMAAVEDHAGWSGLVDWVQWRYDYLNEKPTAQMIDEAVQKIGVHWRGAFYVSRQLNVNMALAVRILNAAKDQGKLESNGTKYRSTVPVDNFPLLAEAFQRPWEDLPVAGQAAS